MRSIKTEMGNLKISVGGGVKSENSCCTKEEPTSPGKTNICSSSSDFETSTITSSSITPVASLSNLIPTNLSIPSAAALKFEEQNGDIEIHSPDYSMWESIFTDHLLDGDFMMCSPLMNNNMLSPNYNIYNNCGGYAPALPALVGSPPRFPSVMHALVGSPPRFPSPLGPHRGKGLSPLNRVFNSPGNQFMQVEQIESLSLPALESLLDDDTSYDCKGNDGEHFVSFSPMKIAGDCYDVMPELLECLTMPDSTRFSDSSSNSVQVSSQESGIYDVGISIAPQPLSQQLQQERQQEQQQRQPQQQQQPQFHQQNHMQTMHNTLTVPIPEPEQEQDCGLQLVHLLLACAEAVSKEDYMLARKYLHHLNRVVSTYGDSMQRVAACFTEALTARLAATLTNKPSTSKLIPFNPFPPDNLEILKIYQILYQACPYIKFAHFTANQAIFEAFESEGRVHVIDLDILQGYQWPAFMQALAARPGGAPFLRITGVGPSPESVRETGRCLSELAHSLHVPFEFHPVGEELEDLKPHMFNRRVGEALAVNSVNRLHRVPGNALGNLLTMIRDQAPNIVTIVEQEASHNGPYFLGRFLEALHYYSAIFDSLDATFPPESAQRTKVEQNIFAPEIRNIVAHEGPERVMRHERLEKWRKIMEGKGFQGVPLSSNAVTQSKILLGLYSCDGYRLTEDRGCLLLGWQDRSILAASAWRC
ncbi:hypothetical protein ACP275_06G004100 [Erythranthe tilingii]